MTSLVRQLQNPAPVGTSMNVAGVMATAGGCLDAFAYSGHGHVFANAMTNNVVLLGAVASDNLQRSLC